MKNRYGIINRKHVVVVPGQNTRAGRYKAAVGVTRFWRTARTREEARSRKPPRTHVIYDRVNSMVVR